MHIYAKLFIFHNHVHSNRNITHNHEQVIQSTQVEENHVCFGECISPLPVYERCTIPTFLLQIGKQLE